MLDTAWSTRLPQFMSKRRDRPCPRYRSRGHRLGPGGPLTETGMPSSARARSSSWLSSSSGPPPSDWLAVTSSSGSRRRAASRGGTGRPRRAGTGAADRARAEHPLELDEPGVMPQRVAHDDRDGVRPTDRGELVTAGEVHRQGLLDQHGNAGVGERKCVGHMRRGRPGDDRQLGQGLERLVHVIRDTVDGSRDGRIEGTGARPAEEGHGRPGNGIAEIGEMTPPDAPRADQEDRSDHQRPPRMLRGTHATNGAGPGGRHARRDVSAVSFGRSRFVMLAAS